MDAEALNALGSDNTSSGVPASPPAAVPPAADAPAAAPAPGAGSAQPAPAPTPTAAQPQHENPGTKVMHSILGALGGTEEESYKRGPDGSMVVTRQKSTPGQQWKRIIAGALVGLGAGTQAGNGNGRKLAPLGAGLDAGMKNVKDQRDEKINAADKDFDEQQKATLNKAQVAHLNQETARGAWEIERGKADISMEFSKNANAFSDLVSQNPDNRDLGVYKTFSDFIDKQGGNAAEIARLNTSKGIRTFPEVQDGKIVGVHVWQINPAWGSQRNTQPVTVDLGPRVGKDGKPEHDFQTVPANAMTNDELLSVKQSAAGRWMGVWKEKYTQDEENKRTGMREAGENTRLATKEAGENTRLQQTLDSRETIAQGKVSRSDITAHDKAYVQPANQNELTYRLADRVYQEYKEAQAKGETLPTGAQSMVQFSAHIATTMGLRKGMGNRVSKDEIERHLGARNISDSAKVAVQRLVNGDVLSPDQWESFHGLIADSRRIRWESAVSEAARKHIPIDFVPPDLHDMAAEVSAPKGATAARWTADGKTLLGHIVGGEFVPLGGK